MAGLIPVLTLPEKIFFLFQGISAINYIAFTLNFRLDLVHFSQTEFPVLILLILLLQNQEHQQKI